MAIDLNIPVDIRTPGQFIEFDNSMALSGLLGLHQKLLLIGQKLSTGEEKAEKMVRVVGVKDAKEKFGLGSMLARMFEAAQKNNEYTETWAVALEDDPAGVAATGTLAFSGAPTKAGTLSLLLGGVRIRVGVASTDTAATIATNVGKTINDNKELSVTATVAEGTVTVTAKHKGECGNDIDLRANYYLGEKMPSGLTLTITAMSSGSGNPDISPALAALADMQFNYIAMPYSDTSNLNAMEAELNERWGPLYQNEGICFTVAKGSSAELSTLGNTRNGNLISILGAGRSPTNPEIVAAAYAAVSAYYLNLDPARPLQTLELKGILPPSEYEQLAQPERNVLLHDGISTFKVTSAGKCLIDRAITTYRVNAFEIADESYLDVNTVATLAYIRSQVRGAISQKYPRHKLADDNAEVEAEQATAQPKDIKAEIITLFDKLKRRSIVENVADLKDKLLVERSDSDPNRVNALIPPDLVGQFRVFAAQIQFRK